MFRGYVGDMYIDLVRRLYKTWWMHFFRAPTLWPIASDISRRSLSSTFVLDDSTRQR